MKKKILLLTMLLLFCFAGTAFAAADVTVKVDGKELPQKGVIVDGRTMVPIRDIAEAVGFDVIFDNRTGRVELQKDGLFAGDMVEESYSVAEWKPDKEGQYERDVHYYDSDVPMQNIGGKMMMPLKVAAEIADVNTSWDGANRVASVTSKQSVVSDDGKIDLMSNIGKHIKNTRMEDAGFEVESFVTYKNEYGNGWRVDCEFKNATDKPFSGSVYIVVYDKKTGQAVEASNGLYRETWEPGQEGMLSLVMYKYDPQLHDIDLSVK